MTPQQKAPLPGATMPWGFIGPWEPLAEYGEVISPEIVPTAANWPQGQTQQAIYPSFCTDTGQQLFNGSTWVFIFWGTWVKNASGVEGYLRNPYDEGNTYGWPPNTPSIEYSQVTAAENWQQQSTLAVPTAPPGPVSGATNAQLRDEAVALLQQMKF